MYLQLYVPAWLWGVIMVSLIILIAHIGMSATENWIKKKRTLKYDNEIAGIVFGVLSLIYSLIIAFVIIAVWENYEELNRTIEKEADYLNSVLVHSKMLPDALRLPTSTAISDYCHKVVEEEWDMADGEAHFQGSAIPSLRMLLYHDEDIRNKYSNVMSILDTDLSAITSLRRERLTHTHAYVPELVWMILIMGSIMVIIFSYFLHMESMQMKRIYMSFLWGIIGMSLFLVYMLDHPFLGSTQVSKAPFEEIIRIPIN